MKFPLNNLSSILGRFLTAVETFSTVRENSHFFALLLTIVNLEPLAVLILCIQWFENKGCTVLVWALWKREILFGKGIDELDVAVFDNVQKESLELLGVKFEQDALVDGFMRVIFYCDVFVCLFWLYAVNCAHMTFDVVFILSMNRNSNIEGVWM